MIANLPDYLQQSLNRIEEHINDDVNIIVCEIKKQLKHKEEWESAIEFRLNINNYFQNRLLPSVSIIYEILLTAVEQRLKEEGYKVEIDNNWNYIYVSGE